jgi:hypothetical protein
VQFINRGPLAANDAISVPAGSAPTTINVLANDSDPDNDTLSVTTVGTPANGSATIVAGGISYAPAAGFVGTDTFTYAISDGNGGTAQAAVTVTVTAVQPPPVNHAPIAVDDDVNTTAANPVVVYVLRNDSDPDGDTLTIVSATPGIRGRTQVNADGSVTYTPNIDWCGTDFFSYTIRDPGGLTATARAFVRRGVPGKGSDSKVCPI